MSSVHPSLDLPAGQVSEALLRELYAAEPPAHVIRVR